MFKHLGKRTAAGDVFILTAAVLQCKHSGVTRNSTAESGRYTVLNKRPRCARGVETVGGLPGQTLQMPHLLVFAVAH